MHDTIFQDDKTKDHDRIETENNDLIQSINLSNCSCFDMMGHENSTYSDITESIHSQIATTIDEVVGFISRLNVLGCVHYSIEEMGRGLDRLGETIVMDYARTPGDDLRDIARSLIDNREGEIPGHVTMEYIPATSIRTAIRAKDFKTSGMEGTHVKVKISKDHTLEQVMIRYSTDKKYVNIPFESSHNPIYIQVIIDKYFDTDFDITAKNNLFRDLESYYQTSRRNKRSADWFSCRVEWVKFSYIDRTMKPCGFRRFKNNDDSDISESEN